MTQVLQIATSIATPLALLGLVCGLAFFAYSRWLKYQERKLQLLPADERAAEVDRHLTRYQIQGKDLSKAARERLIREEMDKRHRFATLSTSISAVVFVICIVTAFVSFRPVPSPPPPPPPSVDPRLTLSVEGTDLDRPSGHALGEGEFAGKGPEEIADAAARWVRATLDRQFPRDEKEIKLSAQILLDPRTMAGFKIKVDPTDPLRQDRFWVFASAADREWGKVGHAALGKSTEAAQRAIVLARGEEGYFGMHSIFVHSERPGYDLCLLELPASGQEVSAQLKRSAEPFTVIVAEIDGGKGLSQLLLSKLQQQGLTAGGPEMLEQKHHAYDKSLLKDIPEETRLYLLRESRVDAFIRGTYRE